MNENCDTDLSHSIGGFIAMLLVGEPLARAVIVGLGAGALSAGIAAFTCRRKVRAE